MAQKPSKPKGTRDFKPLEMAGRNYIFDTVRSVFKLYGYSQIETPAMENLSTLLGKYGEEGDKLLFKILNSGDAFGKLDISDFYINNESGDRVINSNKAALAICEKGLRYDLTVPFARFVVEHRNDLVFPFRRYQIQPVWRADRPQKGRYREFYQCDVDVIGSNSLLNELELIQIVDRVFNIFDINVTIKINNRKVLAGIAETAGYPDKMTDITIAIDKIDKIGIDAVKEELCSKGLDDKAISVIDPILNLKGDTWQKLDKIESIFQNSAIGKEGINDLRTLFGLIESANVKQCVELDLSLARGLNYYTGAIFEVKANDFEIGSICGGGRYDDLAGIFGLSDMSGVGISFGADRIYDVLNGLNKFPERVMAGADILVANMGFAEVKCTFDIMKELRDRGLNIELYPEQHKLKKQFDFASKKGIKYILIVGEEEMQNDLFNLKNIETGEQYTFSSAEILDFFEKIETL